MARENRRILSSCKWSKWAWGVKGMGFNKMGNTVRTKMQVRQNLWKALKQNYDRSSEVYGKSKLFWRTTCPGKKKKLKEGFLSLNMAFSLRNYARYICLLPLARWLDILGCTTGCQGKYVWSFVSRKTIFWCHTLQKSHLTMYTIRSSNDLLIPDLTDLCY